MTTLPKQPVGLFVDRSCRHWIVRDPNGDFWTLPSVEDAWDHREPFRPTSETELEPVPGHYKDMLRLPF
ncbi:MAG: hypothetical protein ACOY3P_18940 [Planctomycetota bacterium]